MKTPRLPHLKIPTCLSHHPSLRLACALFAFLIASNVSAIAATYIADWNGATKGSYASGNVTLGGISWNMTEALIGNSASDKFTGNSVRLRGYSTSSIAMLADKAGGIGTISFDYVRYGTDAQVEWIVEYSSNAGSSWTQAGSFTATDVVQAFSANIEQPTAGRIRIRTNATGASNRRANVGTITLTDSSSAPTDPTISVSGSLAAFSTFAGTASASQSLAVSAANLTSGITVVAPIGFEVSADNTAFGPTASLSKAGGTLYVRVAASAVSGEASSSITLSSPGATDVAVPVTAAVRPTSLALPYGPDTFVTTSFPWYSYTSAGTVNWTRTSLEGNSFMQINGFSSSVPANAWLILGPLSFPAAEDIVATFNMQKAYSGPDTELNFKYSTDYSGVGDPSAATWTTVPFTKPTSVGNTSSSTVFTPSGAVLLPSELAGQSGVFVAFHLEAAGTGDVTSLWRMDDFELFTSALPVISLVVNPSTIDEGQGATGTITLPSVPTQDVNVTVTSAAPSLLQIDGAESSVVTVFANLDPPTAQFGVNTTRDFQPGPDQQVQIIADAGPSYEFGQALVTVRNIDLPAVSLTAEGYAQSFAGFTSQATLPLGWSLTALNQTYTAWGTTDTGAKFNSDTVNVFGYQHAGSTGVVQQILTLRNDTDSEINDVVVSYTGRMFENEGNGRDPSYTVTVDGLTYPALAYSTAEGDNASKAVAVTGLFIAPGQTFQVVWSSDGSTSGSPGSNTRRQIGISDLSVSIGSVVLPPSVAQLAVPLGSIGQTSASANANVTADNGAPITARGFVFAPTSVNPDPLIGGIGVVNLPDATAETGSYSATLTGLVGSTQYSIKAYAINAQGTTYTAIQTFTTLGAPLSFAGDYVEPFNDFTSGTSPSLASGDVKSGWTAVSSEGVQVYTGAWDSGGSAGGFCGGVSDPGALGYQHTSSTGTLTVTLRLLNDSGAPLTQLYVKYLGRVERTAETNLPQWDVTVAGVAAPDLIYSTGSGVDETKSALVTGLDVPAGGEFTITWVSDRGTQGGSSRRIGLASVFVSTSEIPDPTIDVTGSLTPFTATLGTASASQSFNASGVGLNGSITVTAPADYEVSLDNTTFASSVSLAPVNGTVASTTVYVRLAATAVVGSPSGLVTVASDGATSQSIAVTGTVSDGGSAYETWASGFGLDPATNGAPTADPDGDSFSNAQEYAFGTNPTQGNGSLLTTTASGGNLVVTWLERPDVTYNVQSTTNLATTAFVNDGTVSVVNGPTEPAPPADYTLKQFTVPASGSKFYRVSATVP